MASFMAEDVALAKHADLPPLQLNFPAPAILGATTDALKACLEQKWQLEVSLAQQSGWLPAPHQLEALPAFQQARSDDADFIRSMEEDAAKCEAERLKSEEEARRAEEERVRRIEEAKAKEARQRAEAKEKRRLQRMLSKEEERARGRAEAQRRYEELQSRWQATVDERRSAVEEVRGQEAAATARKQDIDARRKEIDERKTSLVKQLRELASRPSIDAELPLTAFAKSEAPSDHRQLREEAARPFPTSPFLPAAKRPRSRSPPRYPSYQRYAPYEYKQPLGSYRSLHADGPHPGSSPRAGRPRPADELWPGPRAHTERGDFNARQDSGKISNPFDSGRGRGRSAGAGPPRALGMRSHTMGGKGGAGSPYDAAPASPKARYDWQLSGGYKDGASDADGGGGGGYRGQFGQRAGGGAWEEPRHGYDGGARDRERDRDREGFPRNDYGAPRGDRPGGFTRPPTFEERELMRQQSDGPAGTGPRDPRTGPHQEQHYHRQGSWNAPGGGQHGPEKHSRGGGPPGGPRQFWNQGRGWGGGAR